MNITLKQLRSFVTIAKLQRMNKAADALCLTQPALSKQIKLLNEQCGQAVFLLQGKCLWLSPFGRSLLPYAERILKAEAALYQHIQDPSCVKFTMLLMPSMADKVLNAYANLKKQHPNTHLYYETISEPLIYSTFEKRIFDIVISKQMINNPLYHCEKLFSFNYHLCAQPTLSSLQRKGKRLFVKNSTTLISKDESKHSLQQLEQELECKLDTMVIMNDQSIKKACLLGLGIGFLPDYLIKDELKEGKLISLPFSSQNKTECFHISYLEHISNKNEIKAFIKLLAD